MIRFDRPGEALLAAYSDGVLAAIGGITIDPVLPDALRMRRFYVRSAFRRAGIGREIAQVLLERAFRSVLSGDPQCRRQQCSVLGSSWLRVPGSRWAHARPLSARTTPMISICTEVTDHPRPWMCCKIWRPFDDTVPALKADSRLLRLCRTIAFDSTPSH
jgi:hypothetical protein